MDLIVYLLIGIALQKVSTDFKEVVLEIEFNGKH